MCYTKENFKILRSDLYEFLYYENYYLIFHAKRARFFDTKENSYCATSGQKGIMFNLIKMWAHETSHVHKFYSVKKITQIAQYKIISCNLYWLTINISYITSNRF